MDLEHYLDELQRFADREFHQELMAARAEYFAAVGRINEEDDLFEAHLDRFLDWFVFARVVPPNGQTVLAAFVEQRRCELPPEELDVYEGFARNVHGLFEVLKIAKTGVHLRNLVDRAKYYVEEEAPAAFTKGQVFEARLLPYRDGWRFSKGYIFHPPAAAKAIQKRMKRLPSDDVEAHRAFMRDLAIRRLRADRYKHVDAAQFYRL
jgi:hypothetical protein